MWQASCEAHFIAFLQQEGLALRGLRDEPGIGHLSDRCRFQPGTAILTPDHARYLSVHTRSTGARGGSEAPKEAEHCPGACRKESDTWAGLERAKQRVLTELRELHEQRWEAGGGINRVCLAHCWH